MRIRHFALAVMALVSAGMTSQAQTTVNNGTRVVVIGIDGLTAIGLKTGDMPYTNGMIGDGAVTYKGRCVLESSSSPNWASMISGVATEGHGITSNDWERHKPHMSPTDSTQDGIFPTIFTVVRSQRPAAEIGAIYHWDGFGRLFEKGAVNYDKRCETEDQTVEAVCSYLTAKKPDFLFIQLDHMDHSGHTYGYYSPEYYKDLTRTDAMVKKIVDATKQAGTYDDTVFVVISDHGGNQTKGHGGESVGEITIPYALFGKGIKKGVEVTDFFYIYDNAATIAYALGIPTPSSWRGRALTSAFEQ